MFIKSNQFAVCATRLAQRNVSYINNSKKIAVDFPVAKKDLHTTTVQTNYAAAAQLPIPNNIDAAETTKFSPQRSRDISATVILSQYGQALSMPHIDITADNSMAGSPVVSSGQDPHLQSYDCFGAVSLNSVMQSNVPTPFGGMHKFSHLNMPGGQWSQENKFMSQNLHNSHYTTLRQEARSDWMAYDQNATIQRKELTINGQCGLGAKRCYSTDTGTGTKSDVAHKIEVLSKKEQLKKAFKEYGATIIVFHVAISLASLGGCYLLVSGGIDMMPLLEYVGLSSTTLSNKVTTGASTFVVAYAIHKVFAPVRISITLGATPFIVRYMRSKGFLKPKIVHPK